MTERPPAERNGLPLILLPWSLVATKISTFFFSPVEVQKDWTLSIAAQVICPLSWAQGIAPILADAHYRI